MLSDTDSETSIDSRSSGFNDGADAIILMNTESAGKDGHHSTSRSSTPQSHKDSCPGPGQPHGQGGPVYSCGCYTYGLLYLSKLCAYRYVDALHNLGRDVTNGQKGTQTRKPISDELRKRFENLAIEVAGVLEAVSRLEAAIDRQSGMMVEVCKAVENNGM
ncbi:hypothetical protein P692DRAFT_20846675 [Suillus brevipes Sb2]|nr:hypothetical protein P692DRAFT_20846675 [Suillus brevipes Sb2]